MEFNVIEDKKGRFQAELIGVDGTVCNLIVDELWNDKSVTVAAYNIEHPLVANPKIVIETDGADTKKAFVDAIARLKKTNTALQKAAEKNL